MTERSSASKPSHSEKRKCGSSSLAHSGSGRAPKVVNSAKIMFFDFRFVPSMAHVYFALDELMVCPGEVPFRPNAMLLVMLYPVGELLSYSIPTQSPTSTQSPKEVYDFLVKQMLEPTTGSQRRPGILVCVDPDLAGHLSKSLRHFQIQVFLALHFHKFGLSPLAMDCRVRTCLSRQGWMSMSR